MLQLLLDLFFLCLSVWVFLFDLLTLPLYWMFQLPERRRYFYILSKTMSTFYVEAVPKVVLKIFSARKNNQSIQFHVLHKPV